jgi:hypothetical protein
LEITLSSIEEAKEYARCFMAYEFIEIDGKSELIRTMSVDLVADRMEYSFETFNGTKISYIAKQTTFTTYI